MLGASKAEPTKREKRNNVEREREYFTKCRLWCMRSIFLFFLGKLLCQLDRARVCSNSQEMLKKKKKTTFVTLLSITLPITH